MKVLVGNIQRFCVDDGPGIRTTVFLKGCSIRCPWCCNPENIEYAIAQGKSGTAYGTLMSEEQILDVVLKDRNYYRDGGGVTFSGGECLLMLPKLTNLLFKLRENHIHIAVETSLFVPTINLESVLDFIDFFYVDFKILLKPEALSLLGGKTDDFFACLDLIAAKEQISKIHPRMPIVPGITDKKDNLLAVIGALLKYNLSSIEIFSVHNLGASKYEDLGISYRSFEKSSDANMEKVKTLFEQSGIKARILKL